MTNSQKTIYNFLCKKKKWLTIEDIIKQGKFKRSLNFLSNIYDLIEEGLIQTTNFILKGKQIKYFKAKKEK